MFNKSNEYRVHKSEDPNSCTTGRSSGTKTTQIRTHWRIEKHSKPKKEGSYVSPWTKRKQAKKSKNRRIV
jgi:hypothetical protein|tara:strand:- start:220 stop:429 length:210 start_codon:yes stop_codon:yes gene_type:complete